MAHLDSAFAPAAEGAPEAGAGAADATAAAATPVGAGASTDPSTILMGRPTGDEGAAPLLKQEQLDAVEEGSDPGPPPTAAASTSFSSASSVSSSMGAANEPGQGQQQPEQPQQEEEGGGGGGAIRPFSRPGFVGRAGYQSKGTRRRLPRVFPSSLVVNTQRAEALFQRHYREQAAAAAGAPLPGASGGVGVAGDGMMGGAAADSGVAGEQGLGLRRESRRKHQQHLALGGGWEGGDSGSVSSAASASKNHEGSKRGGQKEPQQPQDQQQQQQQHQQQRQQEARAGAGAGAGRTTRSRTGKGVMDDWIKVPVTVMGRVGAGGELAPVDGVVYVSMENGRLFKQQGLVFFEGAWQGQKRKCLVEEAELPMISESHPAFRAEAARAEEERGKKTDKARHMLELVCANEEAAFDMERKAADRTLELRRVELKERMLERAEEELEELRAALEEAEAIGSLAAIRGPPPQPAPKQQPASDDSKQPAEVAVAPAEPPAAVLTVSVPPPPAAGATAPATTGQLSAAWNGMEEELQRDPSPDPFALDQPLLAFEALMDGMEGMEGMGLAGLMEVDEEVEQASAGPASRSSSSSASTPAATAGAGAGASAAPVARTAEAREEKKSGDDARVHKSAAGEAAAAAGAGAGAGAGARGKEVEEWTCSWCTFPNQPAAARCAMCEGPRGAREDGAAATTTTASDPQPTAEQAKEEGLAAPAAAPDPAPAPAAGAEAEAATAPPPPLPAAAAAAAAAKSEAAATQQPAVEEPPLPPPPSPKKRKINAADLAMRTLALASDIQQGRAEVGYVRDAEYEDIHDVFMERLHPDPQFGEDEDLCRW